MKSAARPEIGVLCPEDSFASPLAYDHETRHRVGLPHRVGLDLSDSEGAWP